MDRDGFKAIESALQEAGIIGATITPEPGEKEDVTFLTIESAGTVQPQRILNALYEAHLTVHGPHRDGINRSPELQELGTQPGSITFEDKNTNTRARNIPT